MSFHHVEYLLIGGYAVGYHGYPRPTGVMDIWISVNPENADRMVKTLVDFGFPPDAVSISMFTEKEKIIRMGVPPMRLKIVTSISGVEFESCYIKRITAMIEDVHVNIINLDDLKINKKASGRYKDLNDLEQLP
jgi:hypothetical protein